MAWPHANLCLESSRNLLGGEVDVAWGRGEHLVETSRYGLGRQPLSLLRQAASPSRSRVQTLAGQGGGSTSLANRPSLPLKRLVSLLQIPHLRSKPIVMRLIRLPFFLLLCLLGQAGLLSAQTSGRLQLTAEASVMPSVDDSRSPTVAAVIAQAGYQVDDAFSIGLVTGAKFNTLNFEERSYIYPYVPVQVHMEALLKKGKTVPLVFARAGYAFTTSSRLPERYPFEFIWGGWSYTAGLGYRYFTSDQFGVSFHIAYENQQTHFANPEIAGYNHYLKIGAGVVWLK